MEETGHYPCPRCGFDPGAESAFPYALQPGIILNGKYVVGTVLGQGGFGITYIGWDLALESKVAIKEYFPSAQVSRTHTGQGTLQWYNTEAGRTARDSGREMFLKEARKMSRVSDIPQVVRVRDLFQQNNTAYIVMDFIEGSTLKDHLKKTGPLAWEQAKEIFLPAIDAMEQVHKAGLVHRDVSPDNLMLTPGGSVKILDLGAAKDLNINTGASSMQVAKGGFSPLEQYIQTGGSGPWTDVYAMAATMYYTLTGVLPLPSVDRLAEDTLRWDLPQLTALPETVRTALQKAMTVSPKTRTRSMAEFAAQLTAPVTAPPQQPEQKAETIKNKNPEAAPVPKKEPAVKENAVSRDAVSENKKEPGKSPVKTRKRLPVIAAALVLLAVVGGILVWKSKPADSFSGNSVQSKNPVQTSESDESPSGNLVQSGETVSAGGSYTVAVKPDGTVVAIGNNEYGQCDVSGWKNIVAVSAGSSHTVGLKSNGTVIAVGMNQNNRCNVSNWSDITAISVGNAHTIGLKSNGTVVAVGSNPHGQCGVRGWENIVAVSTRSLHTVGLKADGTVVATGSNSHGQCDVSGWKNIAAVSAGTIHTVGLKADGTVVAAGSNSDGQCDVSGWKNIVAISAGSRHTVGLKADGTVVAVGDNRYGQCSVSEWDNIVAISAGSRYTAGLKADGTVVAVGDNRYGQCNISTWKNIRLP